MKKILNYSFLLLVILLLAFFAVFPWLGDRLSNRVSKRIPSQPSKSTKNLHQKLWIADLHADALLWNRDLLNHNDWSHVDVPRLIQANAALQAFTIVSKVPFGLNFERNDDTSDMITFLAIVQRWPIKTWFSLTERALYQAGKLHRFAEKSAGKLLLIKSKSDLTAYIEQRKINPKITAGFLGIEGAQVLQGELANVERLFSAGFRMMAPTHFFDTEVGGSAHGVEKGGLTGFGRQVIQKMQQIGMIVDLAHASPKTIDDVLGIATKPVFVSHTGVKGTCEGVRNLSDEQVKAIAENGGLIGVAFFPGATCGDDVNSIVEAIRYVVDLVGVEYVALGSDFDGAVQTPFDATGLIHLTDALLQAGISENDVALIMGENVQRLLLQLLPERT